MINLRGGNTQIASSNHIQRFANVFRCGLGGKRLSTTRRTKEIYDETLALSLDEIVKSKVLVMGLYKGLEQLFSPRGEHKVRERFVVPFDIGNSLDVELNYRGQSEGYMMRKPKGNSRQILSARLKP